MDERKILATTWLTSATIAARSGGNFNCIGVVAAETFQGEWKAYWGVGIGISERSDSQHIAAYGNSLSPEQAHGFFPRLDITKYKDGPGQAARILDQSQHGEALPGSAWRAIAQVGWLGGSGAVYPLDQKPTDKQEKASYTPLYIQLGEWEWDEEKKTWQIKD